jgi:Flp pilus assembly protein TadB
MKPESESLNIKLPPSSYRWRSQRFFILACALLSLYVVQPTSLLLGVATLLIGTPLFWLIFGSTIFSRRTSGLPQFARFVIVLFPVYVFSKLLVTIVSWLGANLGLT